MKQSILTLMMLALFVGTAAADECAVPNLKHSRELEKLKTLEGQWHGTTNENGKPQDLTVTYHTTAGGSAVVETLMPGTPHEMVSVYHDEGGKLAMTHYCMFGNQPKMSVTKSGDSEINLEFSKDNTIDPKKEDHMHALQLSFVDNDSIVQKWSGIKGGKSSEPAVFKLSRVK